MNPFIVKKLSVIIPCYNEAGLLRIMIEKVKQVKLTGDPSKEIIIINDGSTDETGQVLEQIRQEDPGIRIITHEKNKGKGASIRSALAWASGEITIIQDADLEYDPKDYEQMISPIMGGYADVVLGSRFIGSGPHRVLFFWHTIGNKFLTFLSNLFTGLNLTDMETGYKMFKTEILKKLRLKEKRFGFEPEIIAKVSRIRGIRIYEVGISYYGRTYHEGKKIRGADGFRAIWCILKYNLISR